MIRLTIACLLTAGALHLNPAWQAKLMTHTRAALSEVRELRQALKLVPEASAHTLTAANGDATTRSERALLAAYTERPGLSAVYPGWDRR